METAQKKRLPDHLISSVLTKLYASELPFRIDTLFYIGFIASLLKTHMRAHYDHLLIPNQIQIEDWIEQFGPSEDLNEVISEMADYVAKHKLKPGFTKWYNNLKRGF